MGKKFAFILGFWIPCDLTGILPFLDVIQEYFGVEILFLLTYNVHVPVHVESMTFFSDIRKLTCTTEADRLEEGGDVEWYDFVPIMVLV